MTILRGRRIESSGHRARRGLVVANILGAMLSLLLGVSVLAACAPSQQTTQKPTATAKPTPAPRLVYQADWSHGLSDWMATPGWTVSGGVLVSDTGADRQITSPFRPTTPDYAVEFRVQLISVAQNVGTDFRLSADSTASADGYMALFDHIMLHQCMFACHPHLAVYIEPMVDQDVGTGTVQIHDFEPETHLLTYRVEVRGPLATLVVDGHVSSHARTSRTQQLSAGAIHFDCTGVALRLSDFKVYTL
ncbi:MAG TPA: hypothetical protein VFX24_03520 [Ktedonobacterales bacterium]|nr:hypothetical protein [Ktedonobacterales bacterium]